MLLTESSQEIKVPVVDNPCPNVQTEASRSKRVSIRPIDEVFRYSQAKGLTQLVLVHLANRADENGLCSPSFACLARDIGISRRNIINQIHKLEKLGEIEVTHRSGKDLMLNEGQASNIYRLKIR